MAMAPGEIRKALGEIYSTFPKSSKMFLGYIEPASATGAFEGTTQRAAVISMMSAWQLENKAPTVTFAPTDEKVIDYVRNVAKNAEQSPCQMLVVIDLSLGENVTKVYVLPKGACFIATAAYGSPIAREIVTLSQFRDQVLQRSKLGRAIVWFYYAVSPTMASWIEAKRPIRSAIRSCLIPVVWLVQARTRKRP